MTPEDNITLEPPFPTLEIGNFISQYSDKIYLGVFGVAVVFAVITTVVFLYHWWRYADNKLFALVTSASYSLGVVVLLGVMASAI